MNRNINFIFLLKSLGLGLIISILFRIDFWRLQINFSLSDGFISLWLMGFLPALVLGYPIIRTSWSGWRLICTVFLIYFGITTFMTQIEAVVFLQHLVDIIPTKDTFSLFFNGAVRAAILAPLIVVTHGKYFRTEEGIEQIVKIAMNIRQWIVKLSLVALIYTIIYILFGALVFKPLAGAAFDEYYAGLQMPPLDYSLPTDKRNLICLFSLSGHFYAKRQFSGNRLDCIFVIFCFIGFSGTPAQ